MSLFITIYICKCRAFGRFRGGIRYKKRGEIVQKESFKLSGCFKLYNNGANQLYCAPNCLISNREYIYVG